MLNDLALDKDEDRILVSPTTSRPREKRHCRQVPRYKVSRHTIDVDKTLIQEFRLLTEEHPNLGLHQ